MGAERESCKALRGSSVGLRGDTRWSGTWEEGPVLLVLSGSEGLWERAAHAGPRGLDQLRTVSEAGLEALQANCLGLGAALGLRASPAVMDSANRVELAVRPEG